MENDSHNKYMPDTFKHNPKTGKISADIKNTSFPDLLQHISNTTGYNVEYDPVLETHKRNFAFTDKSIQEALPHVLGDLDYHLNPDTNTLHVKAPVGYKPPPTPVDIMDDMRERRKAGLPDKNYFDL